ncbi:MAG: sigma-70 family RNA polymerase sigma factor [Flavobacteriaceae bacterium]|jgi:RNA polymerase sigma-70 factor (ECF subfamily)|nr:sigma-70 family RNA polymerase sigma factor [Flavobacteriaceae bacterium]MDG1775346.1 sigma-70 family RNA polymerase sigma factor [Flavobacteriaceae bacterium]
MKESEFISFITPLQERLFRVSKRLLVSSQEAQDAVGEITLKLWEKRNGLSSVKNLEAYAMTMTKNFCLDRLKSKQGNHLRLVHVNYEKATDHLSHALEYKDSFSIVEKAMQGLPEVQRLLIQLRDIESLSYAEIEAVVAMKPTAIRVALSRARKTLKEHLVKNHAYGLTKN